MRRLLLPLVLLAAGTALAQAPQGVPVPGPTLKGNAAKAGSFRQINWDELVPKGWDPMKDLKDLNIGALSDADPRATQMLKKLREVWDNAPANPALDGQAVRIPGYVVPLEEGNDGIKEFLLVPYFGACIHSPPPPANQIVLVKPDKPVAFKSMDAVWVSGLLKTARQENQEMGVSGYRIEGGLVAKYVPPVVPEPK